jgi:WD40 repeat protein
MYVSSHLYRTNHRGFIDALNEANLLLQSGSLIRNSESQWQKKMQSGRIDIVREVDLNVTDPSSGAISFVKFDNPNNSIAMVGSYDKHFKIFNVDGNKNEKVLRIRIQDFALSAADFLRNGGSTSQEAILCGRRPHFFSYDIISGSFTKYRVSPTCKSSLFDRVVAANDGSIFALPGDNGYVHIMDGKHKTWMLDLKMNAPSKCVQILNENTIMTSDDEAEVYVWDIRSSARCLHKFSHDDGTASRSLAIHQQSSTEALDSNSRVTYDMAIGAASGVVSLFRGYRERFAYTIEKIST